MKLYIIIILFCIYSSDAEKEQFIDCPPKSIIPEVKNPAQFESKRECDFCYADAQSWAEEFTSCGGKKQSPINIDMSNLKNLTVKKPLRWNQIYAKIPKNMSLLFDKHTVKLQARYDEDEYPKLSGGPLKDIYRLKNINFHWGDSDGKGSEHTVDKCSHPMEMQVLHEKDCDSKGNGTKFLTISYFYSIGNTGDHALDYILGVIKKAVRHPKKQIKLKRYFSIDSLIQPFACEYVFYLGSQTTPPCLEEVTWLILLYPLTITRKQLATFRSLYKIAPQLRNNFRPIQPLLKRKVFFITKSKS